MRCLVLGFLLLSAPPVQAQERVYDLVITADFRQSGPGHCVPVEVAVSQPRDLLRELHWRDNGLMTGLEADGELERTSGGWSWHLPGQGGSLRYCLTVDDRRGQRYMARLTEDWVIMRGDDLFPAARSVALKGSESRTELVFRLPDGWTSATRYAPGTGEHTYRVTNPDRNFDRPTGWLALGRLGIRRDRFAGVRVAVAAPLGENIRRMDLLATLGYALPSFADWFAGMPTRLLVVSAADAMWRGALSGPGSLYLHADRPLVSENRTSPLLHELVHVLMQRQAVREEDWIDEGLAEYLGMLMLHESGGVSRARFDRALQWQARWAREADGLRAAHSRGPRTARAVGIFAALHEELGNAGFRRFVHEVSSPGPDLNTRRLHEIAGRIKGGPVQSLPEPESGAPASADGEGPDAPPVDDASGRAPSPEANEDHRALAHAARE